MALAVDHRAENLLGRIVEARISNGRITMSAEIGRSEYSKRILAEIDDGLRVGFSPGFLVLDAQPLAKNDPAHDDEAFQIEITRHEIYEASSTSQPRNLDAVLLSTQGANMNGLALDMRTISPPEVVHIDDPIGLGVQAARLALLNGKGSPRQRENLSTMLETYDAMIAAGESREVAALAARQAAGY